MPNRGNTRRPICSSQFETERPNAPWLPHVTYVLRLEGYLFVVTNRFSRDCRLGASSETYPILALK